jgi:hypothetical protein
MSLRFFFEPRDLWVGLYVSEWRDAWESFDGTPATEYPVRVRTLYLCFLPTLGLRWDQVER